MAVELEKRLGEEERKDEVIGFRNMYEAMVRTGAATHSEAFTTDPISKSTTWGRLPSDTSEMMMESKGKDRHPEAESLERNVLSFWLK